MYQTQFIPIEWVVRAARNGLECRSFSTTIERRMVPRDFLRITRESARFAKAA